MNRAHLVIVESRRDSIALIAIATSLFVIGLCRALNAYNQADKMRCPNEEGKSVVLGRTAIVIGILGAAVAAALLMSSRFGDESKSVTAVTQAHKLSSTASDRPAPVFAPNPGPAVAPLPQSTIVQNEFAADDAIVQKAAGESAEQAEGSDARDFATRFRDLADHFASEPNTDTGTKLRTQILNHLSEDAGPAPVDLKMECRQTMCRVQLTGLESDKSETLEAIKEVGEFRQVIGMDRPVGDGEMTSDVYLVMH
jgi:hypothetical protein